MDDRHDRLDRRDEMLQDAGLPPDYRSELMAMANAIVSVSDEAFECLDEPTKRKMTALYMLEHLEQDESELAVDYIVNHGRLTDFARAWLEYYTNHSSVPARAGEVLYPGLADYIPDKLQEVLDLARREQEECGLQAAIDARRDEQLIGENNANRRHT